MPRIISWSAALRDVRADRIPVPAGFVTAKGFVGIAARIRPLVVAGQFDRAAIMAAAIHAAQQHQARTGAPWGESMSVALKAAWTVAKAARRASC